MAQRASKHYGNLTRRDLLDLGLSDGGIAYRTRIGRLHRVYRGVYAVGRRALTPLERASAAVLACGPGAALSHSSAMALWGYWKRWDEPFEVTVPGDRRTPGITVHRSMTLHRRDLTTQLGIRVSTPARTVFDLAPRQSDKAIKRTVNTALHSPWLHESELNELVTRLCHLPPARRIAPLLGLDGTPPRAQWEDEFPVFCHSHGLPDPAMGTQIDGYIVDALFPDQKVIVELDSWEFHKSRIAFETDRERDAETLAGGFVTVRITWERLERRPHEEAARLRNILTGRDRERQAA
ncbi:MAG: type IV toxin-antitoxin system AbiEi family antitoxin domain-containing protein [Solirubrobacterales bacterium]|nr:type IV toxin-antitoxin system AbiEi family antitoxin domain-containing protein [Solirubrobacterales bacterium]